MTMRIGGENIDIMRLKARLGEIYNQIEVLNSQKTQIIEQIRIANEKDLMELAEEKKAAEEKELAEEKK